MSVGVKSLHLQVKLSVVVKAPMMDVGCKQPNKIKKENLATLIAEWDGGRCWGR